MDKFKIVKKSEILMRTAGILALLMCMVSLVLFGNISNGRIETTQEQLDLTNVASLTNSNTEDLALEITPTRGGAVLAENGIVYEGEYIKYSFKATNTTAEAMENVRILATIPEGVEYGELESNFDVPDSPYYYNYEFGEKITEKIIELGTIEAGKTKTASYEVHVKDLENNMAKEIVTNINSYIGDNLAQSYSIKNMIEPSDTQLFLGSFTEKHVEKYGLFIKSENKEKVQVKVHFPKIFKLGFSTEVANAIDDFGMYKDSKDYSGKIAYIKYESEEDKDKNINEIDAQLSEDNVLTATFKTNRLYTFTGLLETVIMEKETAESEGTIIAYAEIPETNYMSNENRMKIGFQNIEVTMTSSNDGAEVKVGEPIDYQIQVKNIGRRNYTETSAGVADYVNVNIIDFIPKEIKPISITYDNWKSVPVGEYHNNEQLVKQENIEQDISGTFKDEDGNQTANIDVNLNIPQGETATINVNAEAGMVYEKTEVSNTATAKGSEITDKQTNSVTHTILPYNIDQEVIDTSDGQGDMLKGPVETTPAPTTSIPEATPAPTATPATAVPTVTPTIKPTTTGTNNQTTNKQSLDFKVDKYISKVTVKTSSGTKETAYNNETLAKAEIRAKEMQGAEVKVQYKIVVTNQGTAAGVVGKVIDTLPQGLELDTGVENKDWNKTSSGEFVNTSKANAMINPGESITLNLTATKQMTTESTGTFRNKATIDSISSTTKLTDSNKENNTATAELIISVSTGAYVYISIAVIGLLALMMIAAMLYKSGKLNIKNILKKGKNASIALIFAITLFASTASQAITWNLVSGDDVFVAYDHPEVGTVGGTCNDHTIWMCSTFYESSIIAQSGWRYTKTFIQTVTPVVLTNNPADFINSATDGDNVKYGPLNFHSENCDSGTYIATAYDTKGNVIAQQTLTPAEESAQQFYMIIPKEKCYEGISKIHLEASGTRIDRFLYHWTKDEQWGGYGGPFLADGSYGPNPQPVSTTPSRDEYIDEKIPTTKSVEWANIAATLEVIKVDKDDPTKTLEGVSIRITGPNIDKVFVTDENGRIGPIDNIVPGDYTFKEIEVPHYGYFPDINITRTVVNGQVVVLSLNNEKQTGNLLLDKKNIDSDKPLEGFEFKLQNSKGEYVIAVDKTGERDRVEKFIRLEDLKTTTDIEKATTFVTDSQGQIGIYNILIDTYTIIEVSEGDNQLYEAADKDFIFWTADGKTITGNEPIKMNVERQTSMDTESEVDNTEKVSEITIGNRQKYVDVAGLVWEEGLAGKETNPDYLYDGGEPDHLVDNVLVRVIDKTTNEVAKNRYGDVMEAYTGKGMGMNNEPAMEPGKYKFEKLEIDRLKDYYVEFVYNGMCYQSVPIETFLNNKDSEKVSRAAEDGYLIEDARDQFNNKYQVITNNTATGSEGTLELEYNYNQEEHQSTLVYGQKPVFGWECQEHVKATYPINGVYDQYLISANTYNLYNGGINQIKSEKEIREKDIDVIDNVNLGIYEREQPDLALAKDLKNVRVSINGYSHVYMYEQRFKDQELTDEAFESEVGVKYQDTSRWATTKYTRAIYKADYNWQNENDPEKELQVYFVYEIKIKNTASTVVSTVNEIVDYYDHQYEPTAIYGGEEQYNKESGLIDGGATAEAGIEKGKFKELKLDTSNILNNIEAGKTKSVFVQLQLTREKIKDILDVATIDTNGNLTSQESNESELNNIAEITSYSTFKDNKVYAGIDEDSNPGTLLNEQDVENTVVYEDDTDTAPPVRLEVAESRELTGLVFEDKTNVVQDYNEDKTVGSGKETREGDGIYNPDEDTAINDVKVVLYKASDLSTPVEVWDDSVNEFKSTKDQDIKTNGDGTFTIKGYIPDEYVVQYTWGDEKHNVQQYKATIFKPEAHQGKQWYEDTETRYSDALDSWDERQEIDSEMKDVYWDYASEDNVKKTEMNSTTPLFTAQVEYGYENLKSEYEEELLRKTNSTDGIVYRIMNVDFGIAERPKQSISLTKTISKINLTLLDGEERINAEVIPQEDHKFKLQGSFDYMQALSPDSEHPEAKLWLQLDTENTQGSTVNMNYDIGAQNTSEIDYVDEDYYNLGVASDTRNNVVTLTVNRVNDYLDSGWGHEKDANWTENTKDQIINNTEKYLNVSPEVANSPELNEKTLLSSTEFSKQALEPDGIVTVNLKVVKVLTTAEKDINLENEAEIVYISKNGGGLLEKDGKLITPGNHIVGSTPFIEPDDSKAPTLEITPNPGANLEFLMPVIIAVTSLTMVAIGIKIIKEKVLRKDDDK